MSASNQHKLLVSPTWNVGDLRRRELISDEVWTTENLRRREHLDENTEGFPSVTAIEPRVLDSLTLGCTGSVPDQAGHALKNDSVVDIATNRSARNSGHGEHGNELICSPAESFGANKFSRKHTASATRQNGVNYDEMKLKLKGRNAVKPLAHRKSLCQRMTR
jgi:hypothetical protein